MPYNRSSADVIAQLYTEISTETVIPELPSNCKLYFLHSILDVDFSEFMVCFVFLRTLLYVWVRFCVCDHATCMCLFFWIHKSVKIYSKSSIRQTETVRSFRNIAALILQRLINI